MHHRGLSLIEVLIVLCLITVLAVVSLPMLTHANGQARSAACQANLLTLGQLIESYEDSTGHLPALMNRDSAALAVPTVDQLFAMPPHDSAVFHCPADDRAMSERSGTSYRWHAAWNGQPLTDPFTSPQTPLLSDKAPFHFDQPHEYNALFVSEDDAEGVRRGLTVSPYTQPQ